MSVKQFDDIIWEKTYYGKRKTLMKEDFKMPLTIRYINVETEVKRHTHPHGEVLFVIEGEGIVNIDREEKKIKPGTLIIAPPKIMQGIRRTGNKNVKMLAILPE